MSIKIMGLAIRLNLSLTYSFDISVIAYYIRADENVTLIYSDFDETN